MEFREDQAHQAVPAPHVGARVPMEDIDAILAVLRESNVDFERLAMELRPRPALLSILLQMANSVGVGAMAPIRSIRHGLAMLGLRRIEETLLRLKLDVQPMRVRNTG